MHPIHRNQVTLFNNYLHEHIVISIFKWFYCWILIKYFDSISKICLNN